MPQLPSKLYRIYIKHSLPFINLHTLSYFIQKQTIATSSQHFAYSPRVKTRRYRNLLRYLVRSCLPDLLPGLALSLSLLPKYWSNLARMTKWVVLWFGGEGNLVQCQEFYLNQPWGSCYLFFAEETSAKPSLVTWLHRQQSSFTGRPDFQGSAIGLRTPTGFTIGSPSDPRSLTHLDTLTSPLPVLTSPIRLLRKGLLPGWSPLMSPSLASSIQCPGNLPPNSSRQLFRTAPVSRRLLPRTGTQVLRLPQGRSQDWLLQDSLSL